MSSNEDPRDILGFIGGEGQPEGNLDALFTIQKGVLIVCPGKGSHSPSVFLIGFYGSGALPGIVAVFWLRARELGTILQGPVGTGSLLLGVYHTITSVVLGTYLFSPLTVPAFLADQ